MSYCSKVTCKTEVTVACGGNTAFSEKMTQALFLSGSIESPVSVKKWLIHQEESILTYVGLIVLHNNVDEHHSIEALGASVSMAILNMTGTKDSPLTTQKILICKGDNVLIIDTFCDLHDLDKQIIVRPDAALCYWSIFSQNNQVGRNSRPTRPVLYQ